MELVTTPYVLREVRKALERPEFKLDRAQVSDYLAFAQEAVLVVEEPPQASIARKEQGLNDKKDAPVWAGFEASGARYLVTGDGELLAKVPGAMRTKDLVELVLGGAG